MTTHFAAVNSPWSVCSTTESRRPESSRTRRPLRRSSIRSTFTLSFKMAPRLRARSWNIPVLLEAFRTPLSGFTTAMKSSGRWSWGSRAAASTGSSTSIGAPCLMHPAMRDWIAGASLCATSSPPVCVYTLSPASAWASSHRS